MTDSASTPDLTPDQTFDLTLDLTVILPARNEERLLPACLASLLAQSEPGFALNHQWELILLDDASTDRTPEIIAEAAQTPGVLALPPAPLNPAAFTGKNNACWTAAQAARGRYLLFTDADTLHERGDLSRALHEAEKYNAAMLSYSPRQIVAGFWQRALMPLVFSELASVYPPKKVSDPNNSLAAANGQFLMVEAEAYFNVGGHRAVGREVLEDVALARNLKRAARSTGKGIRFRYAPDALSTRMYSTFPEMLEGWTKNLALLFPSPIALALWRILDLVLFFGIPYIALTWPHLVQWQQAALLVLWVRTLWRFYSRVARSNFPFVDCAISILGIPLFVYLLLRSLLDHRIHRRVIWKGRTYNH